MAMPHIVVAPVLLTPSTDQTFWKNSDLESIQFIWLGAFASDGLVCNVPALAKPFNLATI